MKTLPLYSRKPRRKRIGPEACLQMAVVEHLRLTGVTGLIYFHVPNQGKRSPAMAAHLRRLGMIPGVADLYIGVPGERPSFLELKARGGTRSPEQIEFETWCYCNGSTRYACVDNIDDALSILRSWGALRSLPDRSRRVA